MALVGIGGAGGGVSGGPLGGPGDVASEASTRAAADAVLQAQIYGLDAKVSVRASTTAFIALSGEQTVDGVALVAGDRCLVKNQTLPKQNGIYVVDSGAWSRSTDADSWAALVSAYVFVEEGTDGQDLGWLSTVDEGGTLDTTAVSWVRFSGAPDSAPTALTIVLRDAAGRAQFADPVAAQDAATKAYVDAAIASVIDLTVTTHDATANVVAAAYTPAHNTLIHVEATFLARGQSGTDGKTRKVTAAFLTDNAGVVTMVGTALGGDNHATAGATAWSANITTDGAAVNLVITGQAATDIDWHVIGDITPGP